MSDKVWVSHSGQFRPVQKLWVSKDGQFVEPSSMFVSHDGVFKDASVGTSVARVNSIAAWAGTYPHAEVVLSWAAEITDFTTGDVIKIVWMDTQTGEAGTATSPNLVGQQVLIMPKAATEYRIGVLAVVGGVETFLQAPAGMMLPAVVHTTSQTPAITNPSSSSTHDTFTANWTVGGYVDNHFVRWLNADTFAELDGQWVGAGSGPGTTFTKQWPYPQRSKWAFDLYAVRGNSWSKPVRFTGQTGSLYTPGTYYVPAQQRRTWVVGNKNVSTGFNHNDENWLWHGHGGEWSKYGTELACFYYWNEGSATNPFQTVLNQLNNGARCTSLAIYVHRGYGGLSKPLNVWTQMHDSKFVPAKDKLVLYDNNYKSPTQLSPNQGAWVEMNPDMARLLCGPGGVGIALGNTTVKKDYYFTIARHLSGQVRFILE